MNREITQAEILNLAETILRRSLVNAELDRLLGTPKISRLVALEKLVHDEAEKSEEEISLIEATGEMLGLSGQCLIDVAAHVRGKKELAEMTTERSEHLDVLYSEPRADFSELEQSAAPEQSLKKGKGKRTGKNVGDPN